MLRGTDLRVKKYEIALSPNIVRPRIVNILERIKVKIFVPEKEIP